MNLIKTEKLISFAERLTPLRCASNRSFSHFVCFLLFIPVLYLCSCSQGNDFREIPVPSVHLNVQPYGMDNVLGPIGNYKIFGSYGYAGIIVYHFTETDYLAYDLACPNDYEYGKKVVYDPGSLTLTDKDGCGTVFSILTGFPEKGYLPNPLHTYKTSWNPQNQILTVYN